MPNEKAIHRCMECPHRKLVTESEGLDTIFDENAKLICLKDYSRVVQEKANPDFIKSYVTSPKWCPLKEVDRALSEFTDEEIEKEFKKRQEINEYKKQFGIDNIEGLDKLKNLAIAIHDVVCKKENCKFSKYSDSFFDGEEAEYFKKALEVAGFIEKKKIDVHDFMQSIYGRY